MSEDKMETTTEINSEVVESTIMAQEFTIPPRTKKIRGLK